MFFGRQTTSTGRVESSRCEGPQVSPARPKELQREARAGEAGTPLSSAAMSDEEEDVSHEEEEEEEEVRRQLHTLQCLQVEPQRSSVCQHRA